MRRTLGKGDAMTGPLYVIGDIHGEIAMLDTALNLIAADGGADAPLISLGDLVDRGPGSCAVIETLMQGQAAGRDWTVLKGNHDRMFQRYLEDGRIHDARVVSGVDWLNPRLGGYKTLVSYGARRRAGRASGLSAGHADLSSGGGHALRACRHRARRSAARSDRG